MEADYHVLSFIITYYQLLPNIMAERGAQPSAKGNIQHIMASEDEDVGSAGRAMEQRGGQLHSGRTGQCDHGAIGR